MKIQLHFLLITVLCWIFAPQTQAQWTTQTNVNTLVSTAASSDCKAIETVEGKVWVVYWKDVPGTYYEMRAQLLSPNGDTLLGPEGIVVNNTVPMSSYTNIWSITTDQSGNLYVGLNGSGSGTSVYAHKISITGTQLWGTQGLNLGSGYDVKICPLPNGSAMVSWLPGNEGVITKINANGTVAWSTPMTIPAVVSGHKTSIGEMVALPNSDFVMMIHDRAGYSTSSLFYAQRFTTNGVAVWSAPVQVASSYTTYNSRYDVVADGDTVYLGYTAAVGLVFYSYLQRINPAGTLPWGINGVRFSTQSTYYERDTKMAFQSGSPYIWTICEFTPTSQGSMGEYVQKFDKVTGNRLLTNNAQAIFSPNSTADNSHKGKLQLINNQPIFVYSDGVNNGGLPITLRATFLDQNGLFAWPYQSVPMATYSNYKSRVHFVKTTANQGVCVWTEDRGSGSKIYAQNVIPCIPPQSGFTNSISGLTVNFGSNSSITDTVDWNFGDGNTGIGYNTAHTYADTGTYTVCQKIHNACGIDSICQTIHISCNFTFAQFSSVVSFDTVTFINSSGYANTYLWDFGDGTTDTAFSPVHIYSTHGNYTVCLISTNLCNSDTVCHSVQISNDAIQNSQKEMNFEVFPNPASGFVQVLTTIEFNKIVEYQIITSCGKLLEHGNLLFTNGKAQLNLPTVEQGFYFLKISNDNICILKKLLINQ